MLCAEAFSATMMPDSSEIAIATAVSHRQPNRFLTLFPLVILDSALTFLFHSQMPHTRVAASSPQQWPCHRPNHCFWACFLINSEKEGCHLRSPWQFGQSE